MFNLYINERRIEDVTVLDLKGRIRITGRTRGLHKSIRSLVEEGKTRILLNLSQVAHIDSSGLDELVASIVTAGNQGGEIKLLHLTEQMREVITTANLSALFSKMKQLSLSALIARSQGGEIKLLHLTEQMREVITTANLSALRDLPLLLLRASV